MAGPIIEVKNLSKRYVLGKGQKYKRLTESITNTITHPIKTIKHATAKKEEFWALKNVSFSVEKGEVVGIIGRNGAGKSTLLKLLSQITYPTEGEIVLHGRVGSLLEVGTGFHPELTGRENIYLNGAILGMKKKEIENKFDEIVKFAEIEKFLDTPVKRYSSGMYVRLAFAVAAHLEPEILLVDEVLAVGDAQFQKKCLGKMQDIAENNRTIVFVSHNMSAIKKICNTGILLDAGKVIQIDEVNKVVNTYIDSFTQMNSNFIIDYRTVNEKPMQILSVSLTPPKNGFTFSISEELIFQIIVNTSKVIPGAYITVNILDNLGATVYWTSDVGSQRFKNPTEGIIKLECKCPPYLLTPGHYLCNFAIICLGREVIDHEKDKYIQFTIEDSDSLLATYGVKQPGITAVKSNWKIDKNNGEKNGRT